MGRHGGARGGKRETADAGAPEGSLAVDAVVAEAVRKGARAGRLNDQIQTGASGIRIFDGVDFACAVSTKRGVRTFRMTASLRAG
jgi:hypothetical protein